MIKIKGKLEFFNAKAVTSPMEKRTKQVLSKIGAYIRRSARSSIRKRKKISTPGNPPSSHTGWLKKLIFFAYDRMKQAVVIGPILSNAAESKGIAPTVLEEGGTSVIKKRNGEKKRIRVKPRPYMQPAYQANLPKLPQMWKDSIK